MNTLSDKDVSDLVKSIEDEDSFYRGLTLYGLWDTDIKDSRILSCVERCLTDTDLCWFGAVPVDYTEVRYVAAYALATLRRNLGIHEPIRLQNVIKPIWAATILTIEKDEGLPYNGGSGEELRESFAILRDRCKLPTVDLELNP